jgi:putative ABC transport system permease protein
MLVGIDGRTLADSVPEADTVTLLNNVVVGMIALFAAIMVINSVAAAVAHRRPELATLRLLGATPEQVRGSVGSEAWVVAVLGVLLGSLASAATVVPFALARDEGIMPDGQLWLPIVVAAGAGALTLGAAANAVRRTGTAKPLAIG